MNVNLINGYHQDSLPIDHDVDDHEIFRSAMQRIDYRVNGISPGKRRDAIQKFTDDREFIPDSISIHVNIPRMNGPEGLSEAKKIDRLKRVQAFMLSASADPIKSAANKRVGAGDFIIKQPDTPKLAGILLDVIKAPLTLLFLFVAFLGGLPGNLYAQAPHSVNKLKALSVEELMNIEVTSVSKGPQKLTQTASAIQVITHEDMKRSAAITLPEILRLASNLQIARSGSHDWGISARGFNGAPVASSSLADKLLVMIDGRTVYNPLFGGVYWDVQTVLKEDLEQIEVVSGPGGTLWGANAVNGVINVISKHARETQGLYASGSFGTFLRDYGALRYGSHIDSTVFFRVYGQRYDFKASKGKDGASANDEWHMTHGGFRVDFSPSPQDNLTLQGDAYRGKQDFDDSTGVNGQNVLARWTHRFSNRSDLRFQVYLDRTWRETKKMFFTDEINTFDVDGQHQVSIRAKHRVLYGAGYRVLDDKTSGSRNLFSPTRRTLTLFNAFIQDQVTLVPRRLDLTLGTKWLHNDYTKGEWQPSARVAWTPGTNHTVWAAVSRAVRTPSRFDVDIASFRLVDHAAFRSENVMAYELGYRVRPVENLTFSLAAFYNRYNDLRSLEKTGNPAAALVFGNSLRARSWGMEVSGSLVASSWWRLEGGYTFLAKRFKSGSDSLLPGSELIEGLDPKNQFILQSRMDLPKNLQLDIILRYIDALPAEPFLTRTPPIPPYVNGSLRLAWELRQVTFSVEGQNLASPSQAEFGSKKIPRNVVGKIDIRL